MAIVLSDLMRHLAGWRPDFDRDNQGILYDALQFAARAMASQGFPLREMVSFTQPLGVPIVDVYGPDPENPMAPPIVKEALRIYALRRIDDPTQIVTGPEHAIWLQEVGPKMIPNIQDPGTIPLGVPTAYVPVEAGAILNKAPESNLVMKALVAYTLPSDTDEWPFHPSAESALVDGAIWRLMERPGKFSNANIAREKRVSFAYAIKRINGESSAGMAVGDPRYMVQMPRVQPRSVSSSGGDGPYNPEG